MGFPRQYFSVDPAAPPPVTCSTTRRVRFEEVDPLGMVWHGRYVSFLEDGRVAFGDRFGLSYREYHDAGVAAPIVQLHLDYAAPLRFDESFRIDTTLHWSDGLRLNFEYRITGPDERLVARGYTVQLLTDPQGGLILAAPPMVEEFRRRWREGALA